MLVVNMMIIHSISPKMTETKSCKKKKKDILKKKMLNIMCKTKKQ